MPTRATLLRTFPMLALLVSVGCLSPEARMTRHLERADQYFDEGKFQEATIEYQNVLQIDENHAHANRQLGLTLYELGRLGESTRSLRKAEEQNPEDLEVRLKLAAIYLLGRLSEEAQEEAAFVLEREPDNLEARVVMAEAASTPFEIDEAIEGLEGLRPAQEGQARFHLALGRLYLKKGDPAAGEDAFQEAARREPDSVAAHFALGDLYTAQRNFESAEEHFKKAAEVAPAGSSAARIRLAEFYAVAGRTDEAKQVLTEITTETPDNVAAWRRLAQIALAERNYEESARALDELLERVPYDPDALQLRGQIYQALGQGEEATTKYREAIAVYQEVLERRPQLLSARLRLAQAHLLVGEIEQAKLVLQQLAELAPSSVQPVILLAELRMRTGEVDLAVQNLESLIEREPRVIRAYQLLGTAYLGKQNAAQAEVVSRKYVELAPNDSRAHHLLGMSLQAQRRLAEAQREFEASLLLSPDYIEPLTQLASLAWRQGRQDAALARLRQQIALVPSSGPHYHLLGQLYTALGDVKQAETAFLKAVELEPSLVGAYGQLASLYVSSNQHGEALAKMEEALESNPDNPSVLMLAGMLYQETGDLPQAQERYERALAVQPGFAAAANNLAYLYSLEEGRLEQASGLAERARAADPRNPFIADTLGWILYKRGTYDRALSLLKESAEQLGDNAEVQFHLGMTQYRLNNKEEAWQALNRSLELDSSFAGADEARGVLAELQ